LFRTPEFNTEVTQLSTVKIIQQGTEMKAGFRATRNAGDIVAKCHERTASVVMNFKTVQ